jgi:hypothetical protein
MAAREREVSEIHRQRCRAAKSAVSCRGYGLLFLRPGGHSTRTFTAASRVV